MFSSAMCKYNYKWGYYRLIRNQLKFCWKHAGGDHISGVAIKFLNHLFLRTPTTDRNLHIITCNVSYVCCLLLPLYCNVTISQLWFLWSEMYLGCIPTWCRYCDCATFNCVDTVGTPTIAEVACYLIWTCFVSPFQIKFIIQALFKTNLSLCMFKRLDLHTKGVSKKSAMISVFPKVFRLLRYS